MANGGLHRGSYGNGWEQFPKIPSELQITVVLD